MLEKKSIEEFSVEDFTLTAEDIAAFQARRGNIHESNHRVGTMDYMDILLAGSEEIKQQFAGTDLYKIDLEGSECEKT